MVLRILRNTFLNKIQCDDDSIEVLPVKFSSRQDDSELKSDVPSSWFRLQTMAQSCSVKVTEIVGLRWKIARLQSPVFSNVGFKNSRNPRFCRGILVTKSRFQRETLVSETKKSDRSDHLPNFPAKRLIERDPNTNRCSEVVTIPRFL
jgi:hypothetical protein